MTVKYLNFLLLSAIYGLSFLYIAWRHFKNIRDGGDPYLQGDWLMNFADGPVRRGLSGEVFLRLSDLLNVDVLIVLGVFQIVVLATVITTLLWAALANGPSMRLLLLLLSPALVLFWVNDQYTAFRKELLAYAAFGPLFLFRTNEVAGWRVATSIALFSVAVSFQEANAVFVVPLGLTYWFLLERTRALRAVGWVSGIAAVSSAFALVFQNVSSVDGMCARLLREGVNPRLCEWDAPILWLVWTVPEVVAEGMKLTRMDDVDPFIWAALTAASVLAAAAYLLRPVWVEPMHRNALLAAALAIAPLFFLGSDWGRFISYMVFALVFVALAISETRNGFALSKPIPPLGAAVILTLNLGLGFWHMLPEPVPGFVQVITTAIARALT